MAKAPSSENRIIFITGATSISLFARSGFAKPWVNMFPTSSGEIRAMTVVFEPCVIDVGGSKARRPPPRSCASRLLRNDSHLSFPFRVGVGLCCPTGDGLPKGGGVCKGIAVGEGRVFVFTAELAFDVLVGGVESGVGSRDGSGVG